VRPDEEQLRELVGQVVAAVHPLRVILFGSAARGETGPDSDVDLLIVMPEGTHRRRAAQQVYRAVRGVRTPFDVVVATPRDLETYGDDPWLIYKRALAEGKEVYATPAWVA